MLPLSVVKKGDDRAATKVETVLIKALRGRICNERG
jgi:hypothetical protein